MTKLVLLVLAFAVAACHTVPSFDEEYDLVMLAEQEAMGAIPAHMRLNPKLYTSAEEARKAAEEELRSMGEEVETPQSLESKAVKEAMSLAAETAVDPIHSDLEGIKVDLGHSGDYEVAEPAPAVVPVQVAPVVVVAPVVKPEAPVSEQLLSQNTESDIPLAKHIKKHKSVSAKDERIPDGATHLLEDENAIGTRPSAPQFNAFASFGFPSVPLPNMMPPSNRAPQQAQSLQAPDLSSQVPLNMFNQISLPQLQAPQMIQMPQMPQIPMPQMGQAPPAGFMNQMPVMNGQQFPQMLSQMTKFLQPTQGFPQMPLPFFNPSASNMMSVPASSSATKHAKARHHKKH